MSLTRVIFLAAVLGTAACGSSAPTIKHTVPMERLWSVDEAQRSAVADAYRTMVSVESELEHTKYLQADVKRQKAIVSQEKARAKIDIKIAELEAKQKRAGHFEKLAALADGETSGARKHRLELSRKMRWLKAESRYLSKKRSYLEAELLTSQARFELAKAKLANGSGTAPTGLKIKKFETQLKSFESRSKRRQKAMQDAKGRAAQKEKEIGGS